MFNFSLNFIFMMATVSETPRLRKGTAPGLYAYLWVNFTCYLFEVFNNIFCYYFVNHSRIQLLQRWNLFLFIFYGFGIGIWGCDMLYTGRNQESIKFLVSKPTFDVISVIVWYRMLPLLCCGCCCQLACVVFGCLLICGKMEHFKGIQSSLAKVPGISGFVQKEPQDQI